MYYQNLDKDQYFLSFVMLCYVPFPKSNDWAYYICHVCLLQTLNFANNFCTTRKKKLHIYTFEITIYIFWLKSRKNLPKLILCNLGVKVDCLATLSTWKLVRWKMSDHQQSLFRNIVQWNYLHLFCHIKLSIQILWIPTFANC